MGASKIVAFRGFIFNEQTVEMILELERLIGRKPLITQGSYSSAKASAGTHSGGGAIDWRGRFSRNELIAARGIGFYAWQRYKIPGLWGDHVHAGVLGDPSRSRALEAQETSYRNGRNGLKGNGPDTGPRVKIRTWAEYKELVEGRMMGKDVGVEYDDDGFMTQVDRAVWNTPIKSLGTSMGTEIITQGKILRELYRKTTGKEWR